MTSLCFPPEKSVCNGETSHLNCTNSDQRSLLDFKNGLIDADDRLSSWRGGSNCCEWWGVTCDSSTGAVISLQLHNSSLGGEIRPSLLQLESLQHLDLSLDDFNDVPFPSFLGSFRSLEYLNLSTAGFSGIIPPALGNISTLQFLDLSSSQLSGLTAANLVNFTSLSVLDLSFNDFSARFPSWLANLTRLSHLDLSSSGLFGRIPLGLSELPELQLLNLAMNYNLSASCSQLFRGNWGKIQVLNFASNKLHGKLPDSIGNLSSLRDFDLFENNVEGAVPSSIGKLCNLQSLDFSGNNLTGSLPETLQLTGQLPNKLKIAPFADVDFSSNLFEGPMPLPSHGIELLDLSKNKFSGPIPEIMFQTMPDVIFLSLSGNRLSGDIPSSIGDSLSLQVIDLSNNSLSGNIPSTIGNCSFLKALDLSNNMLTGPLPSSFQNLTSLETMDLGNNLLSGNILAFLGDVTLFEHLRILRLRSNAFSGHIPPTISNLTSLQVLDLAENNLTGNIPSSLGDLNAMASNRYTNQYLQFGKYRGAYYEESLVVNIKGNPQKYTKTLSLVTSIDLSSNNLQGDFPEDVTKLVGLVSLNLSRNQITGKIPETISNMRAISSLDLSNNRLSGSIPLSGAIPTRGQMSTFEQSAFANNSGLCGVNIDLPCRGDDDDDDDGQDNNDGDEDGFIDEWFYLAVGVGFAAGIVIPTLVLAVKKPWSDAYFMFVDRFVKRSWLLMTTL
ncbi:Receptor-like protein 46 [Linum perenne]